MGDREENEKARKAARDPKRLAEIEKLRLEALTIKREENIKYNKWFAPPRG